MIKAAMNWPVLKVTILTVLLAGCGNDPNPAPASEAAGSSVSAANVPADAESGGGWAGAEAVVLTEVEIEAVGVRTEIVEHRSLSSHLSVMGRVLANQYRMAIVSYPFPARIAEIHVRAGAWVRPGDPLVVLQSEEVGEASSAFYSANADHELARANFERETQLFESGVGARKNLSSAEANFRVAGAALNAAEKKLHVLGFTEEEILVLRETHQVNPIITLFAPISGKVIENDMVLGGLVEEATEILTIMDLSRLWVEADVYEKDIAKIHNGQGVVVSVPAYPGDVFPGVITYVGDILDPDTRTITVRTEVGNTEGKLKPGMFADLNIELSENGTALVVPSSAVLDDEGESLVFVRKDGNRFEPRHVVVGARDNGFIEVTDGLEAGDAVVIDGNFQLKSKLYEAILDAGHVH